MYIYIERENLGGRWAGVARLGGRLRVSSMAARINSPESKSVMPDSLQPSGYGLIMCNIIPDMWHAGEQGARCEAAINPAPRQNQ